MMMGGRRRCLIDGSKPAVYEGRKGLMMEGDCGKLQSNGVLIM